MDRRRRRVAGSIGRAVRARTLAQRSEWWAEPASWENYGDVNPEQHGGRFIRWEGNGWHVIETRKIGEAVPEDIGAPGDTHVAFDSYFYPEDVFQGGNPQNGLTDDMMRIVESLGDEMLTLNWFRENPDEVPEGEDPEYAPEFRSRLAYYVVDLTHHIGDSRMDTVEDYWEYLESYGIEESEFA